MEESLEAGFSFQTNRTLLFKNGASRKSTTPEPQDSTHGSRLVTFEIPTQNIFLCHANTPVLLSLFLHGMSGMTCTKYEANRLAVSARHY